MLKNKFVKLGILFVMIGAIALVFSFTQTRININTMAAADWSQTSIKDIGVKTEGIILKSEPVASVSDLKAVDGIGTVKVTALAKHFCTYDTCRFEIFLTILIIGTIFTGLGVMLIFLVLMRRKILYDQIHKDVSIIRDRM
jgi:hypothetical protein